MMASVILASALAAAPASTDSCQAGLPLGTPMPATAADEAGILCNAERRKGFGWRVSSARFMAGERVLVVWWNPYSGRATYHAYGYLWIPTAQQWRLCVQQNVDSNDLSAELAPGSTLVLRNHTGEVVMTHRMDLQVCAADAGDNAAAPKSLGSSSSTGWAHRIEPRGAMRREAAWVE